MASIPVRLPKLTMAATEGTFVDWLVADGARVVEDQPLYVLETDKVEVEVASPAAGVLRHGSVEAGQTYPVGTQVAAIEPDRA
jgi:pyruvate/2-oxoglutarate dehydrogenase complex dihydrolipoamide acyltransferase (E2) component